MSRVVHAWTPRLVAMCRGFPDGNSSAFDSEALGVWVSRAGLYISPYKNRINILGMNIKIILLNRGQDIVAGPTFMRNICETVVGFVVSPVESRVCGSFMRQRGCELRSWAVRGRWVWGLMLLSPRSRDESAEPRRAWRAPNAWVDVTRAGSLG